MDRTEELGDPPVRSRHSPKHHLEIWARHHSRLESTWRARLIRDSACTPQRREIGRPLVSLQGGGDLDKFVDREDVASKRDVQQTTGQGLPVGTDCSR